MVTKLGIVAETFPLYDAEAFDRVLFKSSLNFGCRSHAICIMCLVFVHFIDGGLINIQRLFREQDIFRSNIAK